MHERFASGYCIWKNCYPVTEVMQAMARAAGAAPPTLCEWFIYIIFAGLLYNFAWLKVKVRFVTLQALQKHGEVCVDKVKHSTLQFAHTHSED